MDNINTHLSHLDELPIIKGNEGIDECLNRLCSLRDMLLGHSSNKINVTVKWDGSPALICGVHPDTKRFFVGTKSVFNQTPKINYTDKDIETNHPDSIDLQLKLKTALKYLPELGIKTILQGDMLYTSTDLKHSKINGQCFVTFKPNTILYAIPSDTDLAKKIQNSRLGIVFHTEYDSDWTANYSPNLGSLKVSPNVWYRDASYVDESGTATFTAEETTAFNTLLSAILDKNVQLPEHYLNRFVVNKTIKTLTLRYINSKVREGIDVKPEDDIKRLVDFVTIKFDTDIANLKKKESKTKKEQEKQEIVSFFNGTENNLIIVFQIIELISQAKLLVINKLAEIKNLKTFIETKDGFKVTRPEGFVCVDHVGNAVKLVDRMNFSHYNFNNEKD